MLKIIVTFLKITITVSIIIYLINLTDFNLLANIILSSNKTFLFISFFILLIITILQAYRFCFVSSNFKINISFYTSWKNIALGILYNQVLPSTIGGDTIRFLNLKELKYNAKDSMNSIIIERIYGLISLCILCLIGSLTIINYSVNSYFLIAIQLISLTSIAFFLFFPFIFKKYFSNLLKKIKISELLNSLYFFNNSKTISKVFYYV